MQINYARTYLPELLPDIHGKIVYIDSDCIVQGEWVSHTNSTRVQLNSVKEHLCTFSHIV